MAKRHAAIHAASALRLHGSERELAVDLEVVVDALGDGAARGQFAGVFEEACVLAHY